MDDVQLILVDRSEELCDEFEKRFCDFPHVQVLHLAFENLPRFDCVVAAGNSFGLMDAGVDRAIVGFFGRDLMERIQRHILEEYLGEQPVGTSFVIETHHRQHPFVAHTPTMRAPMNIAHTDHVYNAMRAMLLAVRQHNRCGKEKIEVVACPGLGTGTGGVPHEEAALQMALAYKHCISPPKWINGAVAAARQESVWYGGDWGLQRPRPARSPSEGISQSAVATEELERLRESIVQAVQTRFDAIPEDVRTRIWACADVKALERLLRLAGTESKFEKFREEVLVASFRRYSF